ncbi:hypothetical protein PoB_006751800 [Plakobranchus ocellatus]|uniref:Uncharacterized protein n=1 Tax=Plakobranchus ocellatus TaxID=259542 RepID=A0AAV4D9Y4_9GAST|nr:hypothetical protein PoB_006751800 [Plakobranchus ocellatus]
MDVHQQPSHNLGTNLPKRNYFCMPKTQSTRVGINLCATSLGSSKVRYPQVDHCLLSQQWSAGHPYQQTAFTSKLTFLDQSLAHHNTLTSRVPHHVSFSTAYLSSQEKQIEIPRPFLDLPARRSSSPPLQLSRSLAAAFRLRCSSPP